MSYTKFKGESFHTKIKDLLDKFVEEGGRVEDLSAKDQLYKQIKNYKLTNELGEKIGLEEKFNLLGHPRKSKQSIDVKGDLIQEIEGYLKSGGSLHVNRKSFPFYNRLDTYKSQLLSKGENLTIEQTMHKLGYNQYSDTYFRCLPIFEIEKFRDEDGYVDDFRKDKKFHNFIKSMSETYNIPIYIIITLLMDEKLKQHSICLDRVAYTQRLLENYAITHGSLVGIKRKDSLAYNMFDYLVRSFSDGSEEKFMRSEWLEIFGLGDYSHRFSNKLKKDININPVIEKLKQQFKNRPVVMGEIEASDYRKLAQKAISLGINMVDLLNMYELASSGQAHARFSFVEMKKVPYLKEMKQERDRLIQQQVGSNKLSEEQLFEIKLNVCKTVYQQYKEKLENYLPPLADEKENLLEL